MSDEPLTLAVLVKFHRDVVLPDMNRVVEDHFERRIKPRFDEINGHFDGIYHRLDRLETEFELLKFAVSRVEGRMDVLEAQHKDLQAGFHRLEERLARVERKVDELVAVQDKEPLRTEVADLRARVDGLQEQVRALADRVDRR